MLDLSQDFTDQPVPESQARFGVWYLTSVEVGVAVCVPVFFMGAALGTELSLPLLLLALGISAFVLAVIGGVSSFIGTRSRLSTALMAKAIFGRDGGKIVQLALAASLFGWFGVQLEMFTQAFLSMLSSLQISWHPEATWVTIGGGVLMASTSIIGIRAVGQLARFATPLLVVSLGYAVVRATFSAGSGLLDVNPGGEDLSSGLFLHKEAFGMAIAGIVGAYSVGIVVRPDVQRFALTETHSVISAVLALGIAYPVLLLAAAWLTLMTGEADFTKLLGTYGFGPFSMLLLLLAAWTSNDMNLYGASLNLSTLAPRVPRPVLTAGAAAGGTGLALFGVFEQYIPLWSLLGVAVTPLLALYVMHYLRGTLRLSGKMARVRVLPFIVWGISTAVGVMTTPLGQLGFGVFSLTGVPPLDALLVATALCILKVMLTLSHSHEDIYPALASENRIAAASGVLSSPVAAAGDVLPVVVAEKEKINAFSDVRD